MRLRIDHAEANDKTLPLSIGIAYASEARTDFYYNPLLRHNYDASIIGSGYFTVTVPMPEFFIKESEIQSLRIYINNLAPKDGEGVIEVDYFYIGPEDSLPESSHTVTFRNEDGTVLSEQKVSHGGTATYEGATPTKENDADNHYTFAGWDKELTDITADMTLTATYTAIAHTYTYGNEDTANHKGTCSCGHTVSTAHNWDSGTITTTPGCATAGVTIYTCTTCNATKTESVDPTGHSYIRATVAPTCTAEGYTTYICRVCDHSYTDNRVAPKEHTEVIDSAVAPTCTTDGLTEGKHCAVCSAVITPQEAVPAIGHSLAYTSKDDTTHTITCANCDYKEEVSHSYENGLCICGHVEVKEPIQEAGWKIGHSLNLASDISVNYAITKSTLTGFDMDTVYILAEIDVYEGNTKTGTKTLTLLPVEQGSYYYFTLEGLTAVNMNDEIRVVLYGTKDGRVHYSTVDTYSIAAYAYAQFTKTSAPQKLKVLCAELLRYGAKAQIYKSYRTDSLVDAKMTEGQKALLSDMDAVTFNANNVVLDDLTNPSITWKGKALDLASKVTVKFIFDPYGYSGSIEDLSLRMSYEGVDGTIKTLTVEGAELYNASYGFYVFSIDTLLAAELRTVISAQIYAGDTPVSATLQYSADTYGNGKTGNLGDLCKALFAYSDSAKNYFAN
ncbi:MAG: InlB B-repeat-containing protein, partial [Oscillospiraceae bacterium]|nr:InlB B-repeat-containing protein [Oscillospiraceae bacterium]